MNQVESPAPPASPLALGGTCLAASLGALAIGLGAASRQQLGPLSSLEDLFGSGPQATVSYAQFTGLLVAVLALAAAMGFAWMALSYLAFAAIERGHRGTLLRLARRLATPAVRRSLAGSMLATSVAAVPFGALPLAAAPAFAEEADSAAALTAELAIDVGWGSPDLEAVLDSEPPEMAGSQSSQNAAASQRGGESDAGAAGHVSKASQLDEEPAASPTTSPTQETATSPAPAATASGRTRAAEPRQGPTSTAGTEAKQSSRAAASRPARSDQATSAASGPAKPGQGKANSTTSPSSTPGQNASARAESGPATAQEAHDSVVVEAGDSLWAIAAKHLPESASASDVAAALEAWTEANPQLANPDLLHPGQNLTIPKEHRQ